MSFMMSTRHSLRSRGGAIAAVVGNWISVGALLAPMVIFAVNAVSIVVYVVDLPENDDWEPFYHATVGSFSLRALFARGNDSIFPVGRALDAIAQRALLGNSIAYQFLTMVCLLGGILVLQWKLLSHLIADHIVRRCAFGLSSLSLIQYTYWGQQNNAYIQGIPVLCMIAIIYVIVCLPIKDVTTYLIVGVLSAISGMTYVSGAIGFIPLGTVLLIFGRARGATRLTGSGFVVLTTSTLCTIIQLSFIYAYQGTALHRADGFVTLPTNLDYWWYLLGKIGRSLGILPPVSWASMVITIAATGVLFLLCVRALRHLRRKDTLTPEFWSNLVLCSLASASFLVMNVIAAGRANLSRPESFNGALKVFEFGFMNRFHFFWFTVIWPWMLVCALLAWVKDTQMRRTLAIGLTMVWLCCVTVGGAFDNAQDYKDNEPNRRSQVACMQQKLNDGLPLMCPNVFPADLTSAFLLASNLHASFTRYLQIAPKAIGDKSVPTLFRFSNAPETVHPQNARLVDSQPNDWKFESEPDPQLHFDIGSGSLKNCLAVQVSARIKAGHADAAQLFYTSASEPFFTEQKSQLVPLAADGSHWIDVYFMVSNADFDSKFRLDPVSGTQAFEIGEVEVRCRMKRS